MPSIYFGYEFIKEIKFKAQANSFITDQVKLNNNFIISKNIDYKNKLIELVIGGKKMDSLEIKELNKNLRNYKLSDSKLSIKDGFAFSSETNSSLTNSTDLIVKEYQDKLNSEQEFNSKNETVFKQIKVLFPEVKSFIMTKGTIQENDNSEILYLCIIELDKENENKFSIEKFQDWIHSLYEGYTIKFIIQ